MRNDGIVVMCGCMKKLNNGVRWEIVLCGNHTTFPLDSPHYVFEANPYIVQMPLKD
jgi:hypothetical protein